MSIAQFVGTLKSKSALMLFDRHANLKYRYGSRNFWARGYFADTVVRNKKAIKEYIKNQLKEDDVADKSTRTCLWLAEENKARWITTFSGCR